MLLVLMVSGEGGDGGGGVSPVRYIDKKYQLSISTLLKNIGINMVILKNIDIDINIDDTVVKKRNQYFPIKRRILTNLIIDAYSD